MSRKAKGLEVMKIIFNPFDHIWFKSVFEIEIHEF
jgi:hypothetical protein